MSDSQFNNPVVLSSSNLEESERQLAQATKDFKAGLITESRFKQINELHTIAAEDSLRVDREN